MNRKTMVRLPASLLVGIAVAGSGMVSFAACFMQSGWPVFYQPTPPCPEGKDGTGMCFKWKITNGGYGFGPCVSSDDGAQACTEGTMILLCTEYFGMCEGNKCVIGNPPIPNGDPVNRTQVYSKTEYCFGTS